MGRGILLVGLLATIGGSIPASARSETLVVGAYGGSWGDAISKCIIEPFTHETGIAVTVDPGTTSVTFSKLRQQQSSPVMDVAWLGGGVSEMAAEEGLVDEIDPQKVPNVRGMEPQGVYRDKSGNVIALSTGFFSLGIAYNTKEIATPPTSWLDLWTPRYAGLVTIPSSANASGMTFFVFIAKLLGGGVNDMAPAVKKFRELKVSSYYDSSGAANNSLSRGEAIIGAQDHSATWTLADQGLPIRYVVPKEGVPTQDVRVHLVKGSSHSDSAEKFINFAISVVAAQCMTETLYVGPATRGVVPSEHARQRLPWGPHGSIRDAVLVDWNEINANRQKLMELWNRDVEAH